MTEQQLELFHKAVDAYESGDLETIRTIDFLIDSVDTIDLSESSVDRLKEQIQCCKENIEAEMREVRSSFPYNKKDILEDEVRINDEIEELKKALENYREIYAAYEQRLKTILGDKNG